MNDYNGWTNYATWNVKLWLDNEQSSHNDMLAYAETTKSIQQLAEWIEDYIDNMRHELLGDKAETASVITDLLNHTLANVNWREIAESYTEEHAEGLALDREAIND